MKNDNYSEASANDQIIRYFDQEARTYLLQLNRQIAEYEGEMIKLDEKPYKAPFMPNETG